jgi:apolipoprotein D and lipocalin family protein
MKFKMPKYLIVIIAQVLFMNIPACSQSDINNSQPIPVPKVDIQKYAGIWYEIAKIPNSFQDHCAYGTTAEYKIEPDGDIIVINKCYDTEGELDIAEGVANVVDKNTNAKLEVSFVSFLGIRPFWGDYWIIGLGENYDYAIIGHPERKYGWILSRTPSLPDEKMKAIFAILIEKGHDRSDFELTDQNNRQSQ